MQRLRESLARTITAGALVVGTCLLAVTVSAHARPNTPDRLSEYWAHKYTPQEVEAMIPTTPNPWLSLRPGAGGVDWSFWRMRMHSEARKRSASHAKSGVQMLQPATALASFNYIPRFGTLPFQDDFIEVNGNFNLPRPITTVPLPEDEGSILLASETGLVSGTSVIIHSMIGDGPFGSAGSGSGDLDFYRIARVKKGQLITVDLDTPEPFGPLDPYIEIYNSNGDFLAANDDGSAESFDSFLVFEAPADGDYYLSVAGYGTFILADPFDSSSGLGNIFGLPLDEGEYTVTLGLDYVVNQTFAFFLRPGEVFGGSISGSPAGLSFLDSTKTERQTSYQDVSFVMPLSSPLPGGSTTVNHVVDTGGLMRLRVRGLGRGSYALQLKAALPAMRTATKRPVQTIFLDFDGATVDLAESLIIGAPPGIFITTLSPLSAFLPDWGLTAADEDAVIDAIVWRVRQSLVRDIRLRGGNPDFKIRLLNSRDHADPWGKANVSRVIVGGTIDELGVATIGISQSIDVGNFDTNETAFVLLDLLSDPDTSNPNSLNGIRIAPRSSMKKLIGVAVGEITAHEAGHYLGNWHTDQFNAQPNVMDQGGNLAFSIIGIGDDGVFGTRDDVNVMFGRDTFVPNEGFSGVEDTLNSIAWGATQPRH